MADKTDGGTPAKKEKKQRWYNNIHDAFKIVKRTYKWLPWVMIVGTVVIIGGGIALALIFGSNAIMWGISSLMLALLGNMGLLSGLLRPALYTQVDGTVGGTSIVIQNISKGWIANSDPIATTRDKDLVWRIIGRPGVVFLSEGPHHRVSALMNAERRRVNKVAKNVPVTLIEVGHDEGQVPLKKVPRTLKRLKKTLTKAEVPSVNGRLQALHSNALPIPKGVDPMRARPNRRAMRGN